MFYFFYFGAKTTTGTLVSVCILSFMALWQFIKAVLHVQREWRRGSW